MLACCVCLSIASGRSLSLEEPAAPPASPFLAEGEKLLGQRKYTRALAVLTEALQLARRESAGRSPAGAQPCGEVCRILELRATALQSLGRVKDAEADLEELVRTAPSFALDEKAPRRLQQKFGQVRSRLVGHLAVTCDPPDAALELDGLPVGACPLLERPLLAGEHALSAYRIGFDPAAQPVPLAAGEKKLVHLELAPNARPVVLRTVPAGVEILVDGASAGVTGAGPDGEEGASAPFVVEGMLPGEHVFAFRKSCRAEQVRRQTIVVDLLDRTPVTLPLVELPPFTARLAVSSNPPSGLVLLDGSPAGRTPLAETVVCAGRRTLEVQFGDGIRWRSMLDLADESRIEIAARPRPDLHWSAGVAGEEGDGPQGSEIADTLEALREAVRSLGAYNVLDEESSVGQEPPRASGPLTWPDGLPLPKLSLSALVLAGPREPRLRMEIRSAFAPVEESWEFDLADESAWRGFIKALDAPVGLTSPATGLVLIDSLLGEHPIVLAVRSASPAEAAGLVAGDEILLLDGKSPGDSAAARLLLDSPERSGPAVLEVRGREGRRSVSLKAAPAPSLIPLGLGSVESHIRGRLLSCHKAAAETALLGSLAAEPLRSVSMLNLAVALLRLGQHELAARGVLPRADLPDVAGVSRGTALYLLGVAYERMGMPAQAAAAFRGASGSAEATLDDLEGPPLAPAARLRAESLSGATSPQGPSSSQPPAPPPAGTGEGQRR
jgi:hypothetical protein